MRRWRLAGAVALGCVVAAPLAWTLAVRAEDPPLLPGSSAGAPIDLLPAEMRGRDAPPVPAEAADAAAGASGPAEPSGSAELSGAPTTPKVPAPSTADPPLSGQSPSGSPLPDPSETEDPAPPVPHLRAAPELAGAVRSVRPDGCPRARLVEIWSLAAGPEDELALLALEEAALGACARRERALTELAKAEAEGREALDGLNAFDGGFSGAEGSGEGPQGGPRPEAEPFALAALGVTEVAPEGSAAAPLGEEAASARSGQDAGSAEARVPAAAAKPALFWFSIYGPAGALTAGVSDGAAVWWVREGDGLPGGERVVTIGVRPTRVVLSGSGPLGYRSRVPGLEGAGGGERR